MGISVIFNEGFLPERVIKLPIANCDLCSNVEVVCLSERKESLAVSAFFGIADELLREHGATGVAGTDGRDKPGHDDAEKYSAMQRRLS
jgi:hypothetical protein